MGISIDLNGRKALVSGVSSGIGAGIAAMLSKAGCDIAGCGLEEPDSPGAYDFLEGIRKAGRKGFYQAIDLTQDGAPLQWVEAARHSLGGIDFVISNAGRNIFEGAANCGEEAWQEAMNLDLAVHWRIAKAAFPALRDAQEPVIIIISSNHAFHTMPGCFPYNVAKAGLVALVQSLAIEWGPSIRTVGIAPGFIDTPGGDRWFNSFEDPAAERARTEQSHPVGRLGTIQEIGALCAFLASPLCKFISGTTILVDGGRSALMQDV